MQVRSRAEIIDVFEICRCCRQRTDPAPPARKSSCKTQVKPLRDQRDMRQAVEAADKLAAEGALQVVE